MSVPRFASDMQRECGLGMVKFPESRMLLAALMEEVGELSRAILSEKPEQVYAEAVQVAALAARIACFGGSDIDDYRMAHGLKAIGR